MADVFNILLIEDNPSDAELVELQLSKIDLNIEFRVIDSESQVQELLEDNWPDLILSDYQLDAFTGEQALRLVRMHSKILPFVLISGYLDVKKAIQMMKAGASDFVMKDELERLNPVVKRELENYKQQLKLGQQRDTALHDLGERVKEQKCLYNISSIDQQDRSIEEVLSRAVEYIPPGWQYPEITEALIEFDGNSYQTENYRNTQRTLTAQNKSIKNGPLIVKVVCLEEKPEMDLGLFLNEEQYLIDSILKILSAKINQILDQREIQYKQDLLERSNALAKVGHWELDLVEFSMYWDREVEKIHEVLDDYTPSVEEGINFYKEGKHREKIQEVFTTAIEEGKPYDVELKIITGNGNERWVRVIGKPVFEDGRCVRVYGSFQDIDEKKKTELKLQKITEKQKMLARVARETQNVVIIANADLNIEWVNEAFVKKTGYSFDEVKGKNPKFLYGPDTDKKTLAYIRKNIEMKENCNVEILNYTKTGQPYWINLDISPVTDEQGNVTQFFSIQDDITERKSHLSRIKRERERLQEAQLLGKIGDWDYDAETNEIFWSDQMYQIYDRNPKLGPPSYEELLTYYPEDAESYDKMVQEARTNGTNYSFDIKLQTKSGVEKYIHAEGHPSYNAQENVRRVHGIVQDITERKEHELEIIRREKHLRAVTNNVDAVVFRYTRKPDGSDQLTFVTENIERLFELSAKHALESSHYIWDLILEEDLQQVMDSVQESSETLEHWDHRFRVKLPTGKLKWIHGHGNPTRLEDGSVQWDTMILDVTDQVEQERVNEVLVQEVHHRVKNNLAIINGFLYMQLNDLKEERERLPLELAITRIFSISEVHKLLYDGSNFVDIPVKEYFEHLADHIIHTILVDAEIMIDVNVDEIKMDVNEITPLGMLMNELMTNSVKYAFGNDKKGYISIHISKEDSSYKVSYRDTGSGILQSDSEKMQGSGLNIVRMLLNQLEAEYQLLNKDGFRLDFTFKGRSKGAHKNIVV